MKRKNILYASFLLGVIAIFAFLVLAEPAAEIDAVWLVDSDGNNLSSGNTFSNNDPYTFYINYTNNLTSDGNITVYNVSDNNDSIVCVNDTTSWTPDGTVRCELDWDSTSSQGLLQLNISAYNNSTAGKGGSLTDILFNLTLDSVAPTVNLEVGQYLGNYTWTTDTTPTLYFNFTDDFSPNASCELFVDGTGYGNNTSVQNDTQTAIIANSSLTVGVHAWHVNCTDLADNAGTSLSTSAAFELDVVALLNVSAPAANNTWTTETRQDNVSFTFNFLSNLFNGNGTNDNGAINCELYVTNSTGIFLAQGVNTTALNNTAMTIRNNQTLLADKETLNNGPNVNWTMNCTFNGSSITQALNNDYWILNIDNVTPSTPTLSLTTATSSSLTIAISTVSDTITCTDDDAETVITGTGASQTLTKGGLASSTAYSFRVNCADNAGQSAWSQTYSFSTSAGASGSGGGGSSGGVSSSTSGQYEKTIWASINAGETATVDVDNGVIGITTVEFKVKDTTYGAWVEVQKIDTLPDDVSAFDAAGKVYKNIKITANNVESVLDGEAVVKFKVEKSWLEDNGMGKSDVALFRFVDGAWTKLVTAMDSDDGTHVHYTAKTAGFSYFVIAWEGGEAAPTIEEVGEEAPAEAAAEAVAEEAAVEGMGKGWVITLVVLLVAIAVVVFFWMRKRR